MSKAVPFFNFESIVGKLREVIGAGLVSGLGKPEPGEGCVEAAVCLVLDLPHGDQAPGCVGLPDRTFAIRLNDAGWSSPQARAEGMMEFAVAHLGSAKMTHEQRQRWAGYIAEQTIRRVLPIALRAAKLEEAAVECEREGTRASAIKARADAYAAAAYAAYAAAAYAAYAADAAAAYAADAAAAAAATRRSTRSDTPLIEAAKIAVEAYALVRQ